MTKTMHDYLNDRIKELWFDNVPKAAIYKKVGITRNELDRKIKALNLPHRPNGYRRTMNCPGSNISEGHRDLDPGLVMEEVKKIVPKVKIKLEKVNLLDLKINSCRYPEGDPYAPDFGFCGKPAKAGKAYCDVHHARCHVLKNGS